MGNGLAVTRPHAHNARGYVQAYACSREKASQKFLTITRARTYALARARLRGSEVALGRNVRAPAREGAAA